MNAPSSQNGDLVITEYNAVEMKNQASITRAARSWRGDLHANVPAAIAWANADPVSMPGEIVFNIRDNGQVWTYTFL